MKFLVYGSLNIDKIYSVDHTTRPGETQSSRSLEISPGGKGANQAVALARSGANVYMAGIIGPAGLWLKELLEENNINTDYLKTDAEFTGEAIIQLSDDGQNAILLNPGGNADHTPELMDQILSEFDPGDWLVCQNEIPHIKYLVRKAAEAGLKICINPSPFNHEMKEIPYESAEIVFVNEIEGAAMVGIESSDPDTILKALTERWPSVQFILTAGKEGAFYGFNKQKEKGNIIDMPVVDTTGAGDTFTGYFLCARFVYQYSIEESLNLACKASSYAVSKKGAMVSIPCKEKIFTI